MFSKIVCISFVLLCFEQSFGIIYHLNDTEYEQLPPLFALDNYESCMQSPGGVYCVANLELYTESQNDLYTLIQEYSMHTLKHYNYSKIDRGICVTRTCEHFARNAGLDINRDPRSVLEGCLNETMIKKYDLMSRIYNINCNKQTNDDQMDVDYIDYFVLTLFIMLLLLNLVGSYCDICLCNSKQNHVKGKEVLLCFSVFQNLKDLTSQDFSDPRLNLFQGLHGDRTIITCILVYAHVVLLIATGYTADPHTLEKTYDSVIHRMLYSATNLVQIFFFISGLFMTYFQQIFSEKFNVTWKMMPKIVFQRWWRLTPPAVMMIAFMATWMRHLSHGPLWNTFVANGPSQQCRQFFWAHVFYFNNYLFDDTVCAFQTWYIAVDMQLFIMGTIIHFVTKNRSKKFRILTLISLVLVGTVSPVLHIWLQDLDAFALQKPELYRTLSEANFRILHMLGHNNLTCFFIGMATGYWIYYMQQKKVDYSNSKIGNFLCWCVIPIFTIVTYCGSLFYYDGDRPSLTLRILYAATNKAIIGIIYAIWITGVVFKFNRLSRAIMEWPGWVIPSKLSYSVFLLHVIFVHILLGVRTQLTPVSFLNTFFISIGVLVATYAVALPFYLLIEAPASRILKIITNDKIKKKSN